MARIAIIGAGLTGLGAALFLARRGHQVDLLEQDEAEAPDGAEAAFEDWKRRGVPQARQSHNFLGLSSKVLSEEAPDLLAQLRGGGTFYYARWSGVEQAFSLFARRLVYEARFRAKVEREPGITMHRGVKAAGLIARGGHVVGVRIEGGATLDADMVVDASGRWTQAGSWLAEIGARPWREELQETPIFYLTRWYRLRDGEQLPEAKYPLAVALPYMVVIAFPADNGTFAVSLAPSMADPLRSRLRDPDIFTAFLGELPAIRPVLDLGQPITDPSPLARINNCHRSLVDDGGPCVTGFVLLGDACDHTNPTLARGISLGLAQAQHLAKTVERATEAPVEHAVEFDRWTAENIGCWFRSQVVVDAGYMAGVDRSLAGEAPAPPTPALQLRRAMQILADDDPEVAVVVARDRHLLAPPDAFEANTTVAAKVRDFIERTKGAAPAKAGPSRHEFEALVGERRRTAAG